MKNKLLNIVLLGFLIFQGCLSDIRPKEYRKNETFSDASHEKAVNILQKYANNAGFEKWNKIKSYEVDLSDDFFGLKGKIASPYPSKKNLFHLKYDPTEFCGTLEFKIGKNTNNIWGNCNGITYSKIDLSAPLVKNKNKDIKFWLPTYQYFIEFPFRISNSNIIYHLGTKKYGLNNYDLILVSWNSAQPQRKLDQYLLWVNQSSGLIDKLQFTIREQGAFFKGTAIIDDYRSYDGILIPSIIKIYNKENSTKPLHIMRILNFMPNRFDPAILKFE